MEELEKLGGKYTHEATMNWMEPNYKVLTIEQISDRLLNLSLSKFINEIIEIFKVDTIHFDVLAKCLNLKTIDDKVNSELDFGGSIINISISTNDEIVNELIIKIVEPLPNLGLNNKQNQFDVDSEYELDLTILRNNQGSINLIKLKHIRK